MQDPYFAHPFASFRHDDGCDSSSRWTARMSVFNCMAVFQLPLNRFPVFSYEVPSLSDFMIPHLFKNNSLFFCFSNWYNNS